MVTKRAEDALIAHIQRRWVIPHPDILNLDPPVRLVELAFDRDDSLVPAADTRSRNSRRRKNRTRDLNPTIDILVVATDVVIVFGVAICRVVDEEVRIPIPVLIIGDLPTNLERLELR